MDEQQRLIYQRWLYDGTARLEPMPTRPGWSWLVLRQGDRETRIRAIGPRQAATLRRAAGDPAC